MSEKHPLYGESKPEVIKKETYPEITGIEQILPEKLEAGQTNYDIKVNLSDSVNEEFVWQINISYNDLMNERPMLVLNDEKSLLIKDTTIDQYNSELFQALSEALKSAIKSYNERVKEDTNKRQVESNQRKKLIEDFNSKKDITSKK